MKHKVKIIELYVSMDDSVSEQNPDTTPTFFRPIDFSKIVEYCDDHAIFKRHMIETLYWGLARAYVALDNYQREIEDFAAHCYPDDPDDRKAVQEQLEGDRQYMTKRSADARCSSTADNGYTEKPQQETAARIRHRKRRSAPSRADRA